MARLPREEQLRRFQLAQQAASARGGKLLSEHYLGVDAKYRWQCAANHEWQATYDQVVTRGQWCGRCIGRNLVPRDYLEKARSIAQEHGGYCLSQAYTDSKTHLRWRCSEGHEWDATPNNIARGKWCPWCAGNKVDTNEQLKKAQAYAEEKGGKCLATEYFGNKYAMRWRCAADHEWKAAYNTVVNRGAWCGKCIGTERVADEQLAIAKRVAVSKGGECLSSRYVNNSTKLQWRCARGHKWKAVFYSVVQAGRWCPTCSAGLSERIARHVLEALFRKPFKKKRPSWLVNPLTGRKLELDGFNKDLSLAFEYQGEHHYRQVLPFKMDQAKLKKRQDIDTLKMRLCQARGITLLEIPYWITPDDMPRWISEKITNLRNKPNILKSLQPWRIVQVEQWLESDSYSVEDLCRHAENRGGLCLSKTYQGVFAKYLWECKKGHHWNATWDSLNNIGTWCPYCSGNIVDAKERLQLAGETAKRRGGKCLSKSYEGIHKKMRWRCKKGHEWEARYYSVVVGKSWCPICREPRSRKE